MDKQEPVAFEDWLKGQHGDPEEIGFLQALKITYEAGQDSRTAPPKREWVGLTDEEISRVWHKHLWDSPSPHKDFARAIEAALRSKNNG